jgi:methylmalonic aciduria homocystinuria type C protein
LRVGSYNEVVDARLRLPDFDRPESLAVLIGNTRAMWPCFLTALREDGTLLDDPHPVERYAIGVVEAAVRDLDASCELRWAHTLGDGMVAMQRLAVVAGLAYLSPANLCVHPIYGPWIALRAVAVVDVVGPAATVSAPASPCDSCESACLAALRRLQSRPAGELRPSDWVAVRDACPIGREYRYADDQVAYHYEKDLRLLRHSAAAAAASGGGGA